MLFYCFANIFYTFGFNIVAFATNISSDSDLKSNFKVVGNTVLVNETYRRHASIQIYAIQKGKES